MFLPKRKVNPQKAVKVLNKKLEANYDSNEDYNPQKYPSARCLICLAATCA